MATYARLHEAYGEPSRAYHDLVHIDECLREFDASRHYAADEVAVDAAIWFHDVVYDSRAKDNEEKSSELWRNIAEGAGVHAGVVGKVVEFILATKHAAPPTHGDAKLVVDVDLAILGQPAARFDEYERQIRKEYAWVPAAAFAAGRAAVLQGFLARPSIYGTEHFHQKYEGAARENLQRSLARLDQSIV